MHAGNEGGALSMLFLPFFFSFFFSVFSFWVPEEQACGRSRAQLNVRPQRKWPLGCCWVQKWIEQAGLEPLIQ
ncbi:hypothetical protein V8C37DRAFT_373746 [Trichoderma ceciliae]